MTTNTMLQATCTMTDVKGL